MQIADLFFSVQAEGIDKVGQQISALGNTISGIGSSLVENVSKPIMNFFAEGVELASDINESMNVVNVTFGKTGKEVIKWSGNLIEAYGLTKKQALQYVGSMGAMLKSSGLTSKASEDMSKKLVTLTGDMSSFYNLSHEETWEKIRSGISGETEPLKALGINMSVANLEAYALSEGINKSWNEMSQAEQVTLRYNYLMKVTKDSQGDFARTQDGFANKWRTLQGRIEEFSASIGEVLLPYVEKAINFFDDFVVKITEMFPGLDKGVIIFGLLAAAVGPLLLVVGGLIIAFGGVVGAITAVVALISAVGLPVVAAIAGAVLVLSGYLIAIVTVFTTVGAAVLAFAAKTGILKAAFEAIRALLGAVVAIFKGDFNSAFDLLTEKFGMSKEQANSWIERMKAARDAVIKVIGVVKDITALLGAIFTADKQKMIDLLVKKFGISKEEAQKFADKVLKLKDEMVKLGNKVKDIAAEAIAKFGDKIKQAAKWVYDHREEIARFIMKLIDFSAKVISTAKTVWNKFQEIKKAIKDAMDSGKEKIDKVVSVFNSLKKTIGGVIDKIKGIKFPSPPKWLTDKIPGFATGVRNFTGGLAIVGETGPELVNLPSGANVYNARDTKRMLSNNLVPKTTAQQKTYFDNATYNVNLVAKDLQDVMTFNDFGKLIKQNAR